MVIRKTRHKLPKFPEYVIPGFKKMCVAIKSDRIPSLRMELFDYMGKVEKEHSGNNFVNLKLAREIAQVASFLLDRYDDFPDVKRKLIVAAVSYFISDGDGVSDFDFACGLNDDAMVINYVLEKLEIEDKFIKIQK